MFKWYGNAENCYVFLSDILGSCPVLCDEGIRVPKTDHRGIRARTEAYTPLHDGAEEPFRHRAFIESKWFTRGWKLQELIAPKILAFFGREGNSLGTRRDLIETIARATKIDVAILNHGARLSSVSVAKRMSWAARRQTSRDEDEAYSLLGIFGVNMPMLYGEGSKAFTRLQEEIMRSTSDHSLFAWGRPGLRMNGSLLAGSPADFAEGHGIVQWGRPRSFEMTNRGLRITLPILRPEQRGLAENLVILNCRYEDDLSRTLAMRLGRYAGGDEYYALADSDPNMPTLMTRSERQLPVRLAFVSTHDMVSAKKTLVEITRHFESEIPRINFWFRLSRDERDSHPAETTKFYPTYGEWDAQGRIFRIEEWSRVRAGVVLKCQSGRMILVCFGYDRLEQTCLDETGQPVRKRIPGVWAKFCESS